MPRRRVARARRSTGTPTVSAPLANGIGDVGAEDRNSGREATAPAPTPRTSSPAGNGFLADVCKQWEAATEPAERAGVRVVRTRFGIVLDPEGGVLAKMLPLFRSGLGGTVGSGHQYVSWITLDDVVAAISFLLMNEKLGGPVNLVAPNPVTQSEFAAGLGHAVHRPALVPTPAFAVRLAMGEMANETVLASARVFPRTLMAGGFEFLAPDLESAFDRLFHRSQPKEGEDIDRPTV
jgi:uncharacterized protein (TIGR01777 family)